MTDSQTLDLGGDPALERAADRLDAALARLESGMAGLTDKAAEPGGGGAREAALEAALREASDTMGALIGEVREAIQAAEEAAAQDQGRDQQPHGGAGGDVQG